MISRKTITGFTPIALAVSAIFTSGCAPMSDTQREYREQQLELYRAKFVKDRENCVALGGRIYLMGFSDTLDRKGIPRSRVRYECS